MWQIAWMLELLPTWVWHVLTITGAVAVLIAWVLKRIPFVSQYNLPIKIVGMIALLLGVWMQGGIANEAKWQAKVAELEAKLEQAKQESAKVNTVIETKVVTKTKVIKEKADVLIEYVDREIFRDREIFKDREIIKEVNNCPVPQEVIDVHNEAARMNQAIEELRKGTKK